MPVTCEPRIREKQSGETNAEKGSGNDIYTHAHKNFINITPA
jgi:hypothetical protein